MTEPKAAPDAKALYQTLKQQLAEHMQAVAEPVRLVGIASGGAWLADRLQKDLGLEGEAGVISSSMHRDDFAKRGLASSSQTRLPFDVNGAHVMLIDDVLYTGRTIRAVLNELFDFGRPSSVQLAVLVSREGRQLPVEANLAALRDSFPSARSLELKQTDSGDLEFVLENKES
ncbi:bifunctional pyr operon transcriptional regulator/uracil phosphoribosyltransferase PyrR [Hydrogenophaga sp. 5NK40-0174]|uniref:bifunctional pyr operon transcriptional regulator/uracil phosphoribosyltransferase PyrR n=1 Tax=Hydrogenophaga sp. 5NK40-0174 TaxID=3127649 RepID=UPI0031030FEA